ncbi:type II toxin-antitoxin system RelE/ParE family toxin [Nostoc sp. UHCC 0870]|uniref:type II toxin-antitoxin system RelE/ParE family toxin n=1 Tax=Nostoc sp. UHCC 0870 TaxID=2914041 RepID=UPI001EDFE28B|nr:type II toxin-antitoxin system RelE/ParE family toxin [Nostoc sp. UHCC 0870]UKO96034.1 type II toxin-antitoxin system RelE/ParE family toxin [Nostoc sp. UHCC 0870]
MEFRISISPSALADAEAAYLWIRERDPQMADKWFNGLLDAIDSLKHLPARCPTAPESEELGIEIRQLLYGKSKRFRYRILFGISETEVNIYRIRHTAQRYLTDDDIELEDK